MKQKMHLKFICQVMMVVDRHICMMFTIEHGSVLFRVIKFKHSYYTKEGEDLIHYLAQDVRDALAKTP